MSKYSSKNIHYVNLPKGLQIVDSIDGEGIYQQSISFPFVALFNQKLFTFFDKLSSWIQRKEKVKSE